MLIILLCFVAISGNSQDIETENTFLANNERWTLEIPLWVPGFRGNLAYGNITLDGESGNLPDFPGQLPDEDGNIFTRFFNGGKSLRFFFVGRAAYESDKILIQADAIGGSVGANLKFNYNDISLVDATINAGFARTYFGYELYEVWSEKGEARFRIHGYAGARLTYFSFYSELFNTIKTLDIQNTWLTALVGVHLQLDTRKWQFTLTSDLGGFRFNDRINYSNQLTVYYRVSDLVSIRAGWYDIDVKHRSTLNGQTFKWQTRLSGPSLGVGFHF
ncbi:MAG: hypothetical protein ABFS32_07300 [Bacteroidota bacterium]